MRSSPRTGTLLFLFIFCCINSFGQHENPSVDQWISALSVKKDVDASQYSHVLTELLALDSAGYCSSLQRLKNEGPAKNVQYQARIKLLEGQMQLYRQSCPGSRPASEILEEALTLAYQIEDRRLMFDLHQALSSVYTFNGNLGSATLHALSAVDLAEQPGKEKIYLNAGAWYGLGYLFFHSRQYESSISATLKALKIKPALTVDTLDVSYQMNAWNTLGLSYEHLNKTDSAFWAFDHALVFAEKLNQPFWKGVIKGNKGDVYFKMGRYDSAEVLLTYDYEQSIAALQYDNAANSLQWITRIQLHRYEPQLALKNAREAMRLLQITSQPIYMANTLYTHAQVFKVLGNADSVSYYMNRYVALHDSIEQEVYDSRAEIVHMRMQNQESTHRIFELNKEKRRIALIRNFSVGIILLLTGLAYVDFNRQKLKMRLKQQEAMEKAKLAEAEITMARGQLQDFTISIVEKSALIENLQKQLMRNEINSEQHQIIAELSHQALVTDADWDKFKNLFEKVYPGFFMSIREKANDITLAEQRMAALIRLQLSSKEAASLLGVSVDAIHKARQRLKQRLHVEPESDLEAEIAKI